MINAQFLSRKLYILNPFKKWLKLAILFLQFFWLKNKGKPNLM